jgi:hypothetical protein
MINVTTILCNYIDCNTIASFNLPTEDKPLFCLKHKTNEMINVKNSKCKHPNCDKQPSYNLPTECSGLYCAEHKLENMINVITKSCAFEGCLIRPTFNYENESVAIYCKLHSNDNMIDVHSKKCEYLGCNKLPSYNLPNQTQRRFCNQHKLINMVNVISKKCIDNDCDKIPTYCNPSDTRPIHCATHRLPNEISIKNKYCQYTKCKLDAIYGYLGKRKQMCQLHKSSDMINLNLEYKCSTKDCDKEYDFIIDNIKYCLSHCPNKDYEIKIKKICKICDIEQDSNYICSDCKLLATKKEWAVVRFLKKNIDISFKHNTNEPVSECSNRRPDIIFELAKHCVIVEVDENT